MSLLYWHIWKDKWVLKPLVQNLLGHLCTKVVKFLVASITFSCVEWTSQNLKTLCMTAEKDENVLMPVYSSLIYSCQILLQHMSTHWMRSIALVYSLHYSMRSKKSEDDPTNIQHNIYKTLLGANSTKFHRE